MEINYDIVRSRRKTLSLSVDNSGNVHVKAPLLLSERQIEKFVKQNAVWIQTRLQSAAVNLSKYPHIEGKDGEKLPYLGGFITLSLTSSSRTVFKDNILYIPQCENVKAKITVWYKKQARTLLNLLIQDYAAAMELSYSGVKISSSKKRFGSCSVKNSLNFSFRLVMYDMECIRYVVVHELCHIKHKNHSREYWQYVAEVMPEYKKIRKKMKEQSALMEVI